MLTPTNQPSLSDDPALEAPARSMPERDARGSLLSSRWWLPLVGLITAALCLPFFRTVYGLGDEGLLLNGALRLLRGERLYADFFEFWPPGGFVLTAAWFKVAGISFESARSLAILTIVGVACFTYLACLQASKNAPLSALLTTGWVMMSQGAWVQGAWIQVSHHWLTTLFSMVAAWAALTNVEHHSQRWLRWPLIAGTAAGMAAMVTQHRGALAMLAAVTAFLNRRQHRAQLIVYVLGCALVPAGLLAYVVGHDALAAAFDDVIRFTVGRYASIQGVPFGFSGQYHPFTYLFPLAALLTFLVCAGDWRNRFRDRLFWSCAAFGLAGFVGCFPRPDLAHISFAVPLVCPLLAYCMIRLAQRWRPALWRYRYLAVVVVGVLVIGLYGTFSLHFLRKSQNALRAELVPTPRGRAAIVGGGIGGREMLARIAATPSGDAYFFYPFQSMLQFLAAREQVSKYDVFMPDYTLPSQYQDACISVTQHASWVVINRLGTDPHVLKQWYPAMRNAEPPEKIRFEQALYDSFELVAQEGWFELRRRRPGISDAACVGIAATSPID